MRHDTFKNRPPKSVIRPGISSHTLAANGVRHASATEAETLCGAGQWGIWIRYRQLDGTPIRDNDQEFGRLRLEVVENGRKYHARAGTKSHLFMPAALHGLLCRPSEATLYLCEGEFKAMSACEHGIPAAGVSGLGNAAPGGQLVSELRVLLADWPIKHLVFIGDSDVGIMADFSRAMTKLAETLPHDVDLAVIVPGLSAPAKGLDDQRETLGDAFTAYWATLVEKAVPVARGTPWETLALVLLKRESPDEIAKIVEGETLETAA